MAIFLYSWRYAVLGFRFSLDHYVFGHALEFDANFVSLISSWPTRLIELPPYDPIKPEMGKMERVRLVSGKDAAKLATDEEVARLRYLGLTGKPHKRSANPLPRVNPSLVRSGTAMAVGDGTVRAHQATDGDVTIDQTAWQYVTLSHCWGKQNITRLLKENQKDFEKGIPIDTLPQTFRDAIQFARRLDQKIRYIWIDSLCIVQNDKEDWARESVKMYEVYRNSYCNISATAANNSHQGIYNKEDRDPQLLWEDEVNLNIDGIPGARSSKKEAKHDIGLEAPIRRCTIQDLSLWDREVDDAPVNKRAWVLQERLLAPRVLHFCQDQMAWECSHLDAAEALPHGISKMELKSGEVKPRVMLKSLVSEDYGPKPLAIDTVKVSDTAHENWKRIVERYSRTRLTFAEDKLIALAGIAQMMSSSYRQLENEHESGALPYTSLSGQITGLYVAGMWEKYLASQLLWRVNSVYPHIFDVDPTYEDPRERDGVQTNNVPQPRTIHDGQKHANQANRPAYRAPSFSWAAIDAPQGITLGT